MARKYVVSARALKTAAKDKKFLEEMSADPDSAMARIAIVPNTLVYRMIVASLAVIAVAVVVGIIVLLAMEKKASDGLLAIASAAVGALAGALTRPGESNGE